MCSISRKEWIFRGNKTIEKPGKKNLEVFMNLIREIKICFGKFHLFTIKHYDKKIKQYRIQLNLTTKWAIFSKTRKVDCQLPTIWNLTIERKLSYTIKQRKEQLYLNHKLYYEKLISYQRKESSVVIKKRTYFLINVHMLWLVRADVFINETKFDHKREHRLTRRISRSFEGLKH